MRMFRQGDVLVIATPGILPSDARARPREQGRVVLAHGEATGHAHAISADVATLYDARDGKVYLQVTDIPVALLHEEHAPVEVPPGLWEVRRQREYSPAEIRTVMD